MATGSRFEGIRMTSIHNEWLKYVKDVLDDGEGRSEIEMKQRKQVFYAGATAMFSVMNQLPDDEEDAIKEISGYVDELKEELMIG